MFVAKFLAFALAAVSTSALTTGHLGRSVHHRALAARVAAPNPIAAPEPLVAAPLRKRNKRCKPRTTASPSATAIIPVVANPGAAPTAPAAPAPNKESPAPAPQPTQKESPAPAPPKQTHASPPPASKPKPAPSNGNEPSFMTGPNSGDGTYYGTGLGACGITNNDNDLIAAVSKKLFDVYPGYQGGNPNNNPVCGRKATATYQGNSVTVTITDRCEACDTGDLDFSPAAFRHLADQSIGRIHGMVWNWAD